MKQALIIVDIQNDYFPVGKMELDVSDACATRNMQFGGVAIEASQVHAAFMAALSSPFAQVIETNKLESQLV